MAKGGAKRKTLKPEVADAIVAALEQGATWDMAAAAGGVNETTLHRARADGAAMRSGALRDFADRVERAKGKAGREALKRVWQAIEHEGGDSADAERRLRAAMWLLERRWPAAFARRVEVTGVEGGPIETTDPEANRRALEARIERLAERRASRNGDGAESVEEGAGARQEPE
jgi:hypothetical protein